MSMRRVQSFLLAEEIEQPSHDNRESIGVSVVHGDFEWVEVVVCVVSDKQPSPEDSASQSQSHCCGRAQIVPSDPAPPSTPFSLHDITFSCDSGTLTAIIGHVGCGRVSPLPRPQASPASSPRFSARCPVAGRWRRRCTSAVPSPTCLKSPSFSTRRCATTSYSARPSMRPATTPFWRPVVYCPIWRCSPRETPRRSGNGEST